MKLLHTADWHLGKRLDHVSRLEEQREVLHEICAIADREQVDAVLIAGDLFDSANPPIEATELLYSTLHRLSAGGMRAVIGIAGNHDSPERIEAPDPLARACGIVLAGFPHSEIKPFVLETGLALEESGPGWIALRLTSGEKLRVLLTPYANELRLRQALNPGGDAATALRTVLQASWASQVAAHCDAEGVNVLMAHLFVMRHGGERPEESEDERSILSIGGASEVWSECIPAGLDYVAMGHLHRLQTIDIQPCQIVYSGSPLAYSMSEAGQQKYVMIVEAEAGKGVQTREIPLHAGKPLVRLRCVGVPAALEALGANPGAWVELTLETETFLSAPDRRALQEAHPGLLSIIPVVHQAAEGGEATGPDLSQDMEALFAQYFAQRHGQAPNERIAALFREVLGTEPEA